MKSTITISLMIIFMTATSNAALFYIDDVIAKATPDETKDLTKLLRQIRLVPVNGQPFARVTEVEKGSVWDRSGVKLGDLMANGSTPKSSKTIELKNKLKDPPSNSSAEN